MPETGQVKLEVRVDLEPGKVVLNFDRECKAVMLTPEDAMGIAQALLHAACIAESFVEELMVTH